MKKFLIKNIYKLLLDKIFNPFLYLNIKPMPLVFSETDKCLVISPHPDDESIGCGGIINLYPNKFEVICLTHGDENSVRKSEFNNAMKYAQVKKYKHLCLKDKKLIDEYDKFKSIDISEYDYIFIPYIFDQHRDHKAVSILLKRLLDDTKYKKSLKIAFYEVWSTMNMPQYYVDITSVINKKIEMINLHECQVKKKDYAKKIAGLNNYRGLLKNIDFVEAFTILDANDFKEIVCSLTE